MVESRREIVGEDETRLVPSRQKGGMDCAEGTHTMTTLLLDPPVESLAAGSTGVCYGVLAIEAMPRAMRPRVESLLVECLLSQPLAALPGTDPLEAHWCTRWRRDGMGTVCCREPLTATREEFDRLGRAVSALAQAEGFSASVEKLPSQKGSSQQSARSATESSTLVGR